MFKTYQIKGYIIVLRRLMTSLQVLYEDFLEMKSPFVSPYSLGLGFFPTEGHSVATMNFGAIN